MICDTWLPVSVDAQSCSTKTNQGSLHASSVNKRPRCLLWQWGHSLHIVSLCAAEKTYCHHSAAQELQPPCGGMLYWKPSQIFVGSGPNGVVVVTGCKCSDFIPRHAECLSLPNKYLHAPLRDDLSSQTRKCFPTPPLDEEKADHLCHILSLSLPLQFKSYSSMKSGHTHGDHHPMHHCQLWLF